MERKSKGGDRGREGRRLTWEATNVNLMDVVASGRSNASSLRVYSKGSTSARDSRMMGPKLG